MKSINKFRSPNFNYRKSRKINYIIIHYTAIPNFKDAIYHLCDPSKKVSSHYLINQNGEIYNLVSDNKRAWHCGISCWKSEKDLNSISIGIELDFSRSIKNNKYSNKLISSLIKLIKKLSKKYNIKKENILGHSDIAPYRKFDPGVKFPWNILAKHNCVFMPKRLNNKYLLKHMKLLKLKIKSKKLRTLYMLKSIGYDTDPSQKDYKSFLKLIKSYQRHYNQNNINGNLNTKTIHSIEIHYSNYLLTNYLK